VSIIKGALDMTHKTARDAMTPLDMVFMLPADAVLDEATLTAIMASGGAGGGGLFGRVCCGH
jgi:metal transporter CNNM